MAGPSLDFELEAVVDACCEGGEERVWERDERLLVLEGVEAGYRGT